MWQRRPSADFTSGTNLDDDRREVELLPGVEGGGPGVGDAIAIGPPIAADESAFPQSVDNLPERVAMLARAPGGQPATRPLGIAAALRNP